MLTITATVDRLIIIENAIQKRLRSDAHVQIIEECIVITLGENIHRIQVTPAIARFILEPTAKMISFEIKIPKEYRP